MGEKMNGQAVIDAMVTWLRRWIVLTEDQALVCVLWSIHTWMYERMPATARLAISANGSDSGKTLLLEALSLIVRGALKLATLRPLSLLREHKRRDGNTTWLLDECEKLASAAVGDLRSILTTGAYPGEMHFVNGQGYGTHAPVACALIGDVMEVVYSRAIVIRMEVGRPVGDLRANVPEAKHEANVLVAAMRAVMAEAEWTWIKPAHLHGREAEIWASLFSVAAMMGASKRTIDHLVACSMDMSEAKRQPRRVVAYDPDKARRAQEAAYAERLIGDVLAVVREGERAVWSSVLVDRLKAIPAAPWRVYEGVGLDVVTLARLLKRRGITSAVVRMAVGEGARGAKRLNGYRVADLKRGNSGNASDRTSEGV